MSSLREQLVGAWELVEYKAIADDPNNVIWPLGKNAAGIIMYTPDGYMSAQLERPGVPNFERYSGSTEDWAEVGKHYIAYTGRFFLDEKGDSLGPLLVHEMRNCNLPWLIGDRQRRLCQIKDEADGKYLYLSVSEPMPWVDVPRKPLVRWRRLNHNSEAREPGSRA